MQHQDPQRGAAVQVHPARHLPRKQQRLRQPVRAHVVPAGECLTGSHGVQGCGSSSRWAPVAVDTPPRTDRKTMRDALHEPRLLPVPPAGLPHSTLIHQTGCHLSPAVALHHPAAARRTNFSLKRDESTFVDWQKVKVQESADEVRCRARCAGARWALQDLPAPAACGAGPSTCCLALHQTACRGALHAQSGGLARSRMRPRNARAAMDDGAQLPWTGAWLPAPCTAS